MFVPVKRSRATLLILYAVQYQLYEGESKLLVSEISSYFISSIHIYSSRVFRDGRVPTPNL
jgi:hypothetical protein